MKKIFSLLLAAMLLVTAACNKEPQEPEVPVDPNFPVTVGDVVVDAAPTAVVTLTPAATEMVCDLGYRDLLVGVSDYCQTPSSVLTLPSMGSAYTPDHAAIKKSAAQLLITTVQPTEADLVKIQQAGLQVVYLPRADSVAGIQKNYTALSTLLGGKENGAAAAKTVCNAMDAHLAAAKQKLSGLEKAMDATLLVSYPYHMATGDTLEGKLLEEIGFTCSGGAYENWLYPKAELKALEPDVIFCAEEEDVDVVIKSYEYSVVAAVKNDKVTDIDFTAFQNQSLRMFDLLEEMAAFAVGEEEPAPAATV